MDARLVMDSRLVVIGRLVVNAWRVRANPLSEKSCSDAGVDIDRTCANKYTALCAVEG